MDLSTLTPDVLRKLILLVEKKQTLADQLAKLDHQILNLSNGITVGVAKSKAVVKPKTKRAVKGMRGKLKNSILQLLNEAGATGIAVKHIAAKLSVKPQSVHAWFQTTGRKSSGISKVGRGVYALAAPASS